MLISKILQDEFTRGYRGRLMALNGLRNVKALMEEISACADFQSAHSETELLAHAAGLSFEHLVREHSLRPLFQMVPPEEKSAKHGAVEQADMSARQGIKTWEKIGARFCLKCIAEEVEDKGYAYWHRSHQLPGICWCSKHGTQLAKSSLNTNAFDGMPTLDMESTYEFSEGDFSEIYSNKVIQRYADIVFSTLDSNKPLSSLHAIYRMGELLKVDQIRVGKNGQRPTLTDRLLNQMPVGWLQIHYPSINNRAQGEYFHAIDSIAARPVANNVYALGLASLFESSNDAINYWFSDTDDLPNARKSKRRYEKGYWGSDELCKLYVQLRCSYKRISEAIGTDLTYTKKMLKAAGWPALRNPDIAAVGEAISEIQLGMSVELACASNGVRQSDVEKLLMGNIPKLLRAIEVVSSLELLQSSNSLKKAYLEDMPEPEYI